MPQYKVLHWLKPLLIKKKDLFYPTSKEVLTDKIIIWLDKKKSV